MDLQIETIIFQFTLFYFIFFSFPVAVYHLSVKSINGIGLTNVEDKIVQSVDAKDNELVVDGATKETDLPARGEEGNKDAEETKEG